MTRPSSRFLLFLLPFVLLALWIPQAAAQTISGLNVVILVDSSGSMAESDPTGFRSVAAHFLLDYLQAVGEVQGLTHRFAAANFDTELIAGDTVPLTALTGNASQDILPPRVREDTDFIPPLAFAQEVQDQAGTENPTVVFLFTDGDPKPLGIEGLDGYFTTLRPQVEALQATGVQIFVIALGDENASSPYWVELLGADHYRRITTATDLAGVYRELLADLLGLRGDSGRTLLEADEQTLILEPYLERVVFSLIKSVPGAQVTLQDPDNALIPPARGGGANDLHAIYVVESPPNSTTATPWRITIQGGEAEVWVDQKLPTLVLDAPDSPQPTGLELDFTGQLMQGNRPVVDADLALSLSILDPAGTTNEITLTPRTGGAYTTPFNPSDLPGTYFLALSAEYAGASLFADHQPVTLTVSAAPFIESLNTDDTLFANQPLTVTARVVHPEQIGLSTTLQVFLQDASSFSLSEATLLDDGQSPDGEAGDGLFTAVLTPLPNAGRYTLKGVISGSSVDGLTLNFSLVTGAFQVLALPQTATVEHPTPEPTETPTRTPTPTSTPDFWERFLPQSTETASDSYSFWLTIGLIAGFLSIAYIFGQLYQVQKEHEQATNVRMFLRAPLQGIRKMTARFQNERKALQTRRDRQRAILGLRRKQRNAYKAETQQAATKRTQQATRLLSLWRAQRNKYKKQTTFLKQQTRKTKRRTQFGAWIAHAWYQRAIRRKPPVEILRDQLENSLTTIQNASRAEALNQINQVFKEVDAYEMNATKEVADDVYKIIYSLMEKHFKNKPTGSAKQVKALAQKANGNINLIALSQYILRDRWATDPQLAIEEIYECLNEDPTSWKRIIYFIATQNNNHSWNAPPDIKKNGEKITQLCTSLREIYTVSEHNVSTIVKMASLLSDVREGFNEFLKDDENE